MAKTPAKSAKNKEKQGQSAEPAISQASSSHNPAKSTQNGDSGIWQDERFQHLLADPRFKGVPKTQRKVKIDKRFQGMFTDEKFKVKYTVDKYGRPVNKSNAEDLRKFYELDESSDEEKTEVADVAAENASSGEDIEAEQQEQRAEEQAISRQDDENNALVVSDDEEVPETLRERLTNPIIDYARGEGRLLTDSSSDDESSGDDEGPELQIDHVWGELDNDAETTEESTRRLAVCNMDWDRIRAEDIMVLLSSFLPPGGSIASVKIYPSEYGKARMAEEEVHGPTELVGLGKSKSETADAKSNDDNDDSDEELVQEQDSDAEEGDDYHMEKLRQYQLNRLRYYYGVVECDSIETADKVYKECDGIEYESSATRVDLRFIPDDTSFDEDEPRDECHDLPDASHYKPRQFTTTALQQAKVDLTWDETALERRELGDKLSSGKVDEMNDKELRQIVAYSTEESDSEEEPQKQTEVVAAKPLDKRAKQKERIQMYKGLLAEINEQEKQAKEQKYEMEMSWDITNPKDEKKAEDEAASTANAAKSLLTPIEKVLQKRSEKNKQRKEQRKRKQLEAKGLDPDAQDNNDEESIPDGIDMNDAYFAEEFANGDYVPSQATKKAKSKKQKQAQASALDAEESERQQQELELLLDDDDDDEHETAGGSKKQHFSLSKILKTENESKTKRKRRKQLKKSKNPQPSKEAEDNFKIDLSDNRFSAVYKLHDYNIDPSDSHFKGTKGMQEVIGEKLKRRQKQLDASAEHKGLDSGEQAPKRSKQQLQNSLLVKSLKRKIQQQRKS